MTDYRIAIPTYNRAARVAKLLRRMQERCIDLERVTLFVDSGDPAEAEYLDLEMLGCSVHISAVQGVAAQRMVIADHYPAGTPVVSMDDDIRDIIQRRPTEDKPQGVRSGVRDWGRLFTWMFEDTADRGLKIWGTRPTTNILVSEMATVHVGLRFAVGTLFGQFSRPGHPVNELHVRCKEDYEMSVRAYLYDGGLVRYGDIAADADHYRQAGGCVDWRTQADSLDAALYLTETYPELVRWNRKRTKATGHAEVLLAKLDRKEDEDDVL